MASLPNLLTLSRILAVPLLVLLTALSPPLANVGAAALFAFAGFTDWLDGRIARSQNAHSELGRMLDPIADKLLVGATLMLLCAKQRFGISGFYPAIVILCREILVSGLREFLGGLAISLPVSRLAKWKTGLQMTALGLLLLGDDGASRLGLSLLPLTAIGTMLLWLAAGATLITGWDYLRASLRHINGEAGQPNH